MPNIQKHKHVWIKTFSRAHTIQRISFLWSYFITGIPQDRTIKANALLALPSEKKYDYYMYEDEWMGVLEKISSYLLARTNETLEKEFYQTAEELKSIAKEVFNKDLTKWSNAEMKKWFIHYSEKYAEYSLYAFTPWAVDLVLAPRLNDELRKINVPKADEWFEVISTPTRYNRMTQQRIDLLKIAVKKDWSKLKDHTKKYFWLPIYNLGDKPWNEDDFKEHIKQIGNPVKELQQKEQELDKRKSNFQKIIKEINPNPPLKKLIEVCHLYTYLRDERVDEWRLVLYYIEPFYVELARRAKIEPEDSVNMLDEEIVEFLETNKLPQNLQSRKINHAIIYENDKLVVLTKTEDIENVKIERLGETEKKDITEIRGMAASRGVAKGIVRVIRTPQDLSKLKAGEVLVAHHTTPDYVVGMGKASAIVTDEGGITSHAAIVSREMGIPCITSTHIGSSALKTGDFIEVDAINGVVKIIERKK